MNKSSNIECGDFIPMFVIQNKNKCLKMEPYGNRQFYLLFINNDNGLDELNIDKLNLKYPIYKISKNTSKYYFDENLFKIFTEDKVYNLFFIDKNLKVGYKLTTDNIEELTKADNEIVPRKNMYPPILIVPDVITQEFANELIEYLDKNIDKAHKDNSGNKSRNHILPDKKISDKLDDKLCKSLFPEIYKTYYHTITHRECWKICRYIGEDKGKFNPHRDTIYPYQHRRYAMSLILNDSYEGGGIRFPEYSDEVIQAPKYSAVIFPGTLYHEVKQIEKGTRYVIISFLFTENENKKKKVLNYTCNYTRNMENINYTDLVKYN